MENILSKRIIIDEPYHKFKQTVQGKGGSGSGNFGHGGRPGERGGSSGEGGEGQGGGQGGGNSSESMSQGVQQEASRTLRNVNWTRKASRTDDVKKIELSPMEKETVDKLPSFELKDVVGRKFDDDFKQPMPQFFIATGSPLLGSQRLLVNTEGFDYIRYAARI